MSDAYSALKVIHHPERLAAYKGRKPFTPSHVEIILSDWCPQSCRFCAYRMEGYTSNALFGVEDEEGHRNNNPRRMIPQEKVEEILLDCSEMGVQAIQFTGGGEPTAHPFHTKAMELVLSHGMELALVTNGVLLSPQDIELLMDAAWVRISLDAGDVETYSMVRRVPPQQFQRALDNIKALADKKRATGSSVVIGVGFVVTPDNWTEVLEATTKAKALGADNIRISAMFSPDDEKPYLPFYEQAKSLIAQAKALASTEFSVFDRFGDRLEDLRLKSPDYSRCGYQHFTTYIGGDLNVYRCCNTAYNERGLLGSLKERRFKDFWLSKEVQESLYGFEAPGCSRCQFNGINRVIAYAASPRPEHAAFV